MNPNTPQPTFELPVPLGDNQEAGRQGMEAGSLSAERPPVVPQAAPVASAPPAAIAQPATNPLPLDPKLQTPQAADDADLIEKEWVEKAKRIVASTKDDPFTQNREISRFKADYMKKRYNKEIKLDES